MKPDWDSLAQEYEGSEKVLIADVDCTTEGKPLCDKYGVKGFPTIKTFRSGDTEGEVYEGGRDLKALKEHAETLGPACSIDAKEYCKPEDIPELEKYAAMSQARRDAKIIKLKNAIDKEEKRHEGVQKSLQQKYEESNGAITALKEKLQPKIKLLVAATPKA